MGACTVTKMENLTMLKHWLRPKEENIPGGIFKYNEYDSSKICFLITLQMLRLISVLHLRCMKA